MENNPILDAIERDELRQPYSEPAEVWQRKTLKVKIQTPTSTTVVQFKLDYIFNNAKEWEIFWPETACGFCPDDLKEIFELYVEADLNGGEVPLKAITYTKEQAVNHSRIEYMEKEGGVYAEDYKGAFIDPIGLTYSFRYSNPTNESTIAALSSIFSQIIL